MPPRIGNERAVLACLLALFVCRAVLASMIVPPWQGPDEPAHFIPAQLLAEPTASWSSRLRVLQADVLQSMAKHRWWEPYGSQSSDSPPTEFSRIPRLSIGAYSQPVYYGLGAAVLRLAPTSRLEGAYWRLRILSAVLGMGTLALGWAATAMLFGTSVASGATAVAALHPQFLLTSISVNPDALVIFMGTAIWWLLACVVTGRRVHMSLLLIVVIAATILLTKRNAIPLAAVAAILAFGWLVRPTTWLRGRTAIVWTAVLCLGGAIVLGIAAVRFENLGSQLALYWSSGFTVRRTPDQTALRAAVDYARTSLDYVWLVGGWLRFTAPEPWLWVVRVLTAAGFAGAAVVAIRSRELRRPMSIACVLVIVQVIVVVGWGFWTLSSPQGRYLFPVIAPATALLWLGLTHAAPARVRPYAAPTLIATLAILDAIAFAAVLIPAYLPWG